MGRFPGVGDVVGVDVAAAAALVAGGFGKGPDEGHLLVVPQGQHPVLVFQQHGAFRRRLPGQGVVLFKGQGGVFRPLGQTGQNFQGVQHYAVQLFHGELAFQHRQFHLTVGIVVSAGHFQVQSRLDAGDPVVDRKPVGHDHALVPPLLPQQVGEQPAVVGGIGAVDPVIGAHQTPRLGVLDGILKAGQVQFPEGTLVHLVADIQPPVLLVVGGKVLQAAPHAVLL